MSTIVVVASPNTYTSSLGAMLDAYARLAEPYASNPTLGDYARIHTQLWLATSSGSRITLAGGRQVEVDGGFAGPSDIRLIYLPSFQVADPDALADDAVGGASFHAWLRQHGEAGTIIGACGASVCHLAAAGLLAGRKIAVHPRLAASIERLYPQIEHDPASTISVAGKIMTCGPDAHNAALVLRLIERAFSIEAMHGLALREPPPEHAAAAAPLASDPLVAQAQIWIRDHFASDVRIPVLAAKLGVSQQALIRRFRNAGVGTPRSLVQRTRVESAMSMLAETDRTVAEIAQLVGYTDIPSFRRIFVAVTGLAPSTYRQRRRPASRQPDAPI